MPQASGIGIALSGTAPAMTLMSGAMLAFAERDVEFDVISTTGVGSLIGLLYLAPRGGDRVKALRELPNLFVSDWLYKLVPINFKVFHKYSPFAETLFQYRKRLPKFQVDPLESSEVKRFLNDWIDLWATVLSPPSYQSRHNGLMSHVSLIEDLVDFRKLKDTKTTRFYQSAFSLRKLRLRFFDNQTMSAEAYNAAQTLFMLFPPVHTADDILISGATRDPTALQAIWLRENQPNAPATLSQVLALDPVSRSYWRKPVNVYDAFQLMILNPIAALQELLFTLYLATKTASGGASNPRLPDLHILPLTIESSYYPHMLEWTHANAVTLQKIGHDAAVSMATALARGEVDTVMRQSRDYATSLQAAPRPQQFLEMFTHALDEKNWGHMSTYLTQRYEGEVSR